MPRSHPLRGLAATLALASLALASPAAARAATVAVTGDDGNPVGLVAGAPQTIRNMQPEVSVAFPPGEGRYVLTITDQAGNAASSGASCFSRSSTFSNRVAYRGNGTYTVTVANFAATDRSCVTATSTETYQFAIAAAAAVPPAGPFLLREPDSFSTSPAAITLAVNPGADSYEVHFAKNGAVSPTGDLVGPFTTRTAGSDGRVSLRPDSPGVYSVVARAKKFSSGGEAFTPWSAPARIVVKAPFDFKPGIEFLDRRGPSYRVRASLRESSARGRVSIALARGTRGGVFRSIGSAAISSKGTITKRFKATRIGNYRLRFTYRGSSTIAAGRGTIGIQVRRTFSFGT